MPGFYGIVPNDFHQRFPDAHVVPQGEWAGFNRPDWLDPRDPMFARVASIFYRHQSELFGDSSIYDMEVFQEGGNAGNVPVQEAGRAVQRALWAALQLIETVTFTGADFSIQHDGVCRMNPELARRVAQLALEHCEGRNR